MVKLSIELDVDETKKILILQKLYCYHLYPNYVIFQSRLEFILIYSVQQQKWLLFFGIERRKNIKKD